MSLGTFEPIKSEIENHKMHIEDYNIPKTEASKINKALKENRRIIAVGTTVVRTLESAFENNIVKSGKGSTDIFIKPGYEFKTISGLITNFHTPGSTLLLLVSAFAGFDLISKSYEYAIEQRLRFFSYGDAMLIT